MRRLMVVLAALLFPVAILGEEAATERITKEIPVLIIAHTSGNIIISSMKVDDKSPFNFCISIDNQHSDLQCFWKADSRVGTRRNGEKVEQTLYIKESLSTNDGT